MDPGRFSEKTLFFCLPVLNSINLVAVIMCFVSLISRPQNDVLRIPASISVLFLTVKYHNYASFIS